MNFVKAFAAATVVMVAGCASVGQDFSMADVDAMQPGVTTLDQAKAKLGKPARVLALTGDRTGVVWTRSQATIGSASSKSVGLIFDKSGVLLKVASRSEIATN